MLQRLPCRGATLSQLAAETTGDAHALDRDTRLASVLTGALSRLAGIKNVRSAVGWRRAWDTLGVACDELNATVLVLNLRPDTDSLTGRMLATFADGGEPCRLTARSLLRSPPCWIHLAPPSVAYVCENPAIVTLAADRFAERTRPLICLEGQSSTAARVLLKN